MTEQMSPERKRLLYRAMHRGTKEADIVVGKFAEIYLPQMADADLEEFQRLLDVPDQDLYAWIIQREPTPEKFQGPVMTRLQAFDVAETMSR